MFHLFDALEDDSIIVALGFSDPRSLCSTTMACRRLRHLGDATWKELDKRIRQNKRKGGETSRERVLSSLVVHGCRRWKHWLYEAMLTVVEARSCDESGMRCISSADLRSQNHLFYLRIESDRWNKVHSFLDMNPKHSEFIATNKFVDLPLQKKHLDLVRNANPEYDYDPNFLFRQIVDTEGRLNSFRKERVELAFSDIDVTIIAINRRTLQLGILFKKETDYPVDPRPWFSLNASFRPIQLSSGSYRVEFRKNWTMKRRHSDDKNREVGFYFESDSVGLVIGPARDIEGL